MDVGGLRMVTETARREKNGVDDGEGITCPRIRRVHTMDGTNLEFRLVHEDGSSSATAKSLIGTILRQQMLGSWSARVRGGDKSSSTMDDTLANNC